MSLSQHVKQQGSRGLPGCRGRMAWPRSFAAFLAMGICVIASIKFDNPLNWIGPNLSSSQVTIGAAESPGPDR